MGRSRTLVGIPMEEQERQAIKQMLDAVGFCVFNLSQSRAARQTPGLGDLYAFHPGLNWIIWWEVKRSKGGKHSPMQLAFAQLHTMHTMKVTVCTGDRSACQDWLVRHGLATSAPFALKPSIHPAYTAWKQSHAQWKLTNQLKRRKGK